MTNGVQSPEREALYRNEKTVDGEKRAMWKPDQKNLSLMKNLAGKSTTKEDLVMSFCARTCPMEKSFTLLDQHTKIAGWDLDSGILKAEKPDPLSAFALQVLKPSSDTKGDEK